MSDLINYGKLECSCNGTGMSVKPFSIENYEDGIVVYYYCGYCRIVSAQYMKKRNVIYDLKEKGVVQWK